MNAPPNQFIQVAIHYLRDVFLPRLKTCLNLLDEEELWENPAQNLVSPGNLVVHLAGNLRQYLISGLSGAPDVRDREREFQDQARLARDELINLIESTLEEAETVLEKLSEDALAADVIIQGMQHTGYSAVIHAVEHFSYHLGQITFWTKYKKQVDVGYYRGVDLNLKNRSSLAK